MQKKHFRFPFGLRTVKTAAAVIIAMIIVDSYGATTSKLIFAMLGAMAAVQPTFKESLESCLTQIVGLALGGLASVLLLMLNLPMLPATGIGIILVITIYNALRIPYSPSLPCFIVVMVCTTPDVQPITYALGRFWDSAIGLGVGMLINTLVFPYDNSQQIHSAVASLDKRVLLFLEDMFDGDDILPDSKKTSAKINEIGRQLAIFSKQRLPFHRRRQQQQLEFFQLCEKKARLLLSHMEVLCQQKTLGVLDERNYQFLIRCGAEIPRPPQAYSSREEDLITNYHVHRILLAREELLVALSAQEQIESDAAHHRLFHGNPITLHRSTLDILVQETTRTDLPHILSLWNNGDVMNFVGFPDGLGETMEGLEDWLGWIEENRPTLNHYSIYLPDGTYCGETFYEIDLEHDNATSLDIKLLPSVRGKGIATLALSHTIQEAFSHGASLVWVDPNPANEKALALYERLGFQRRPLPEHLQEEAESVDFTPIYMEIRKEEFHYE